MGIYMCVMCVCNVYMYVCDVYVRGGGGGGGGGEGGKGRVGARV